MKKFRDCWAVYEDGKIATDICGQLVVYAKCGSARQHVKRWNDMTSLKFFYVIKIKVEEPSQT